MKYISEIVKLSFKRKLISLEDLYTKKKKTLSIFLIKILHHKRNLMKQLI